MAFWFWKKRHIQWREWELPGDVGKISLPDDSEVEMEDDTTLLCSPDDIEAVSLRVSSISFRPKETGEEDSARSSLREKAAEKGLRYAEIADKAVVSYQEHYEEDSVPFFITFWEVGSRNTIVIISATVPENRVNDRNVKAFLGLVPQIIKTIDITTTHKTISAEGRELPVTTTTAEPGEQQFRDFGQEECSWLAGTLKCAQALGAKYASGGVLTPEELDCVFARWMQDDEEKESHELIANALGAAFGEHLVEHHGFRWAVVTDEYGTEIAVKHPIGETTAFPIASVRKRIEDSILEFFQDLHVGIVAHLQERAEQG